VPFDIPPASLAAFCAESFPFQHQGVQTVSISHDIESVITET
jgi:hypothetical protein